jgi:hypothetical protein
LTLGRACGCCSARNLTRSCHRCSQSSRQSSGKSSSRNSPRRSSGSSADCDLGSHEDSYGGGIGGVTAVRVNSELRIQNLGCELAAGGACTILHIWGSEVSGSPARPRVRNRPLLSRAMQAASRRLASPRCLARHLAV